MMARFRSRMAMRPINRIKHVVDISATASAGVAHVANIITSVDAPVLANTSECVTGSKVYGFYLKVVVASNEDTVIGAIPNVYMAVMKNPANDLTNVVPNAVGSNDLKKYVIHQEMVMIENRKSGIPTTLFNGVIKIPKGYARNGPADRIKIIVLCPAIDFSVCYQAHFKEFR